MAITRSTIALFGAELIGTALLLSVGLSIVIFNWGTGSSMTSLIPSEPVRRIVTGFLFGTTGCLVTLSPVGKISGAHINPAVSVAFWLRGKMKTSVMIGYIGSQMIGAIIGCLPLLLWGDQGKSIHYGLTEPGKAGVFDAFLGEVLTTIGLITTIFIFVGSKKLRNYTPYTMPFLYGFMVCIESPFSGCSTNPARSFGPAVVSQIYSNYWLYVVAPFTGVLLVVGIFRLLRLHRYYQIEAARISYHESPTPQVLKTA
ncbi:MIP/aquaporin family protein [Spirosoma flavum]|uniref:MIP/aquaporin family protein n=1 Tax=Spirosoma flavum TaxID=2048557 RepID=A0ABW6AMD2_9BACT